MIKPKLFVALAVAYPFSMTKQDAHQLELRRVYGAKLDGQKTPEEHKEHAFKMWCSVWSATIHEQGAHPDQPRAPALRRERFEEWWEREGTLIYCSTPFGATA